PACSALRWTSLAARTLRPAFSKRAMIWPVAPLATASGLMMVSVRSMAMDPLFLAEDAGDGGAHVRGTLDGGDAGGLHRLHLLGGGALAARDDGAGVAHAPAGGRGLAADEADHRLRHVLLHEGGGFFLGGAPDLPDHHDRRGVRVGVEELQDVDEAGAVDRIAPDAHAGRLAEPAPGELVDDLVGERAAARDHPHVADLVDVARHDADLGLTRRDQAGTVGADQPAGGPGEEGLHPHHVGHRHTLGDAHDQRHAGVGGLHDRVGGRGRRHKDQGAVGAGGLDGSLHRIPDREALVGGAALARSHAAHDLGAVLLAARGVEGALLAGDPLHQHPGVLVDEHAHAVAPRARATTFWAPSPMSSTITSARPDSASIFLPCSTLVPSARRTTGSLRPSFLTAEMMPSARRSTLRIPPKTLMNTAFTLGSDERMRNAFSNCSGEAPPATSRKLAGSPPASLTMSMVAMASPAPFTMQPTLPSSLM